MTMSLTSDNDGTENTTSSSKTASEKDEGMNDTPPAGSAPTKSTPTTNNKNNNNSNRRKNKKRSRKDMGPETQAELQLSLKQDRYEKLLYMATKQLMKQAKQVRAFMVQRNIRKLKKQTTTNKKNDSHDDDNKDDTDVDNDNDNDDNQNLKERNEQSTVVVQASLQPLKDLSLELVVQQAMRQLGLFHANPTPGNVEPPKILPPEQAKLVSSVLDHKRFQSSLEEWNEKVADFRRFCLSLNDRNNKFAQDPITPRGKKSKTTSLRPQDNLPTSYFCTSLNDNDANDNDENNNNNDEEVDGGDMMAYGPAATMTEDSKPKNRQGQRARKAKALALQAKKEGRQYESLNWREEKNNNNNDDNNNKKTKDSGKKPFDKKQSRPTKSRDHHVTTTIKGFEESTKPVVADVASQHPSWAAKQQQKSGIVAFQGKKITFD